jgi:ABC-type uncharacterized transport system substrate-binding protein
VPLASRVRARRSRAASIEWAWLFQGGAYADVIAGLRDGLKDRGLEDGKQVVFLVRDAKGDLKAVEAAARALEAEKVDLIFAIATSVAVAVKRATTRVPIVFYAGTDPIRLGLIQSFRKPGGRLTGVHGQLADLTAKRLQLLKEMVTSQTDYLVEVTNAKRLPAMFNYKDAVTRGALASYGESYFTLGRLSAKHVQQILLGADPGTLPVEQSDRPQFVVNLKTAKALGLTVPPSVLARADQIVE